MYIWTDGPIITMRLIFLNIILSIGFVVTTYSNVEGLERFSLIDEKPFVQDHSLLGFNDTQMNENEKIRIALERYHKESKNPVVGFMLGLCVGFGAGHYYAGDIKTGIIISVWETIGLPYALSSILYFAFGPRDAAKIYMNVSGIIIGTAILFDAIHSIFVIKKHNKRVMENIIKEMEEINPALLYIDNKIVPGISFKF